MFQVYTCVCVLTKKHTFVFQLNTFMRVPQVNVYVCVLTGHVCLNCPCDRALAQPHLRSRARSLARYRTRLHNLSSGAVMKRRTCSGARARFTAASFLFWCNFLVLARGSEGNAPGPSNAGSPGPRPALHRGKESYLLSKRLFCFKETGAEKGAQAPKPVAG